MIRKSILNMIFNAKSGHIGGSFSCVDILVSLYYGKNIKFNPKKPSLKNRDRVIISKGHASAAFYSILSHLGYFKKSELKRKLSIKKRYISGINIKSLLSNGYILLYDFKKFINLFSINGNGE